ncbi:Cell division protein DivIB [Arenibacter antarcticus]|uniref:Uncharacterized protein n=1 Tax=Arenibacter antarcticus TaxID=2040469 RepID=A0ABW5VJJ2_9FLAO|nr:hypothetical protein [Arenibacter sp. H213]MCM4169158.1 hypothetical protein [Arenibacter sp. H213]
MSGAGHVADMNNRLNRNRALKPSNRTRFKENNRDTIISDSEPIASKLTFKKVSEIELKEIKNKIRNRARKEHNRKTYILIGIILALLLFTILLVT